MDANHKDASQVGSCTEVSEKRTISEENTQSISEDQNEAGGSQFIYLHGAKFWLVAISLAISQFLVTFELCVVSTALVSLGEYLSDLRGSSWIVTSYLVGYTSLMVIFSKLSDIIGRRPLYLLTIFIFVVFSAACGSAQTMTQLITFRAFQGVGGGGCYSLCIIIVGEVVPKSQYHTFVSCLSITSFFALLLGPIIGGAIVTNTTWRWAFLVNVPFGIVAFVFAVIGMPRDFPYQGQPNRRRPNLFAQLSAKSTWARVDMAGAVILFCSGLALTAGFQEAGSRFPWKSAYVITLLTLGGILLCILLVWERYITRAGGVCEPVLPWRFFTSRLIVGLLLSFLLAGAPLIVSIFLLPQRFQFNYGSSALQAGVKVMPFTLAAPFGGAISSGISARFKVPAIWVLLAGSCLQIMGYALLSAVPQSLDIPTRVYIFEVIAGLGCGLVYALLYVIIPEVTELRDQALAVAIGSQLRPMGAAIVTALAMSVFSNYATSQLARLFGISNLDSITITNPKQFLESMPVETLNEMKLMLVDASNRQMLVLCAFSALQIPAILLIWKTDQIKTVGTVSG